MDWRIKSMEVWISRGDENTEFFQWYANQRKSGNTIWELQERGGENIRGFKDLEALGC